MNKKIPFLSGRDGAAETGCLIGMNGLLSRKENGAAGAGNTDLIPPVRARTCAEDVGRTGDACYGSRGCSRCVPRYFAGRRVGEGGVRASALWAKHGIEPGSISGGKQYGSLPGHFGAWRCHVKTTVIHSDRMFGPRPGQRGIGVRGAGPGTAAPASAELGEDESQLLWEGLLQLGICPLSPFSAHAAQVGEEI